MEFAPAAREQETLATDESAEEATELVPDGSNASAIAARLARSAEPGPKADLAVEPASGRCVELKSLPEELVPLLTGPEAKLALLREGLSPTRRPTPAAGASVELPSPFVLTKDLDAVVKRIEAEPVPPRRVQNQLFQGAGGILPTESRQHALNCIAAEILGRLARNVAVAAREPCDVPQAPPSAVAAKTAELAKLAAELADAAEALAKAPLERKMTVEREVVWKQKARDMCERELSTTVDEPAPRLEVPQVGAGSVEPFVVQLTPNGPKCHTAREFLGNLSSGEDFGAAKVVRRHDVSASFTARLDQVESPCAPDNADKPEAARAYTHFGHYIPWRTGLPSCPTYPVVVHELRVGCTGHFFPFQARLGRGPCGWEPAERAELPWLEPTTVDFFRADEVLDLVDVAAAVEAAQDVAPLGLAGGGEFAQDAVAVLHICATSTLKAYPIPRSMWRVQLVAGLKALARLFAEPSSHSDLGYFRGDFGQAAARALEAIAKLPDDREPELASMSFRMRQSLPDTPFVAVKQVASGLDKLDEELRLLG